MQSYSPSDKDVLVDPTQSYILVDMLSRWNTRLESLGLYIWNYFYNMTTKLSALPNIERVSLQYA